MYILHFFQIDNGGNEKPVIIALPCFLMNLFSFVLKLIFSCFFEGVRIEKTNLKIYSYFELILYENSLAYELL